MKRLLLLLALPLACAAQTIMITAPATNATIAGFSYNLTCSVASISTLARVKWLVDSEIAGWATATEPYTCPSFNWNPYNVGNGSSHVVDAIAYDAAGTVLATATEITGVHVENWLPQLTCSGGATNPTPDNSCGDIDVTFAPAASINFTPSGNAPAFATNTLTLKPSGGSAPSLVGSPSTTSNNSIGTASISSPARTIASTANYVVVAVHWFNPNGAHISTLQDTDGVNFLTATCTSESVASNSTTEICFAHPSTTHGTANYQVTATWTGAAGLGIHVFEVQNAAASTPQDVLQNDTASTGGVTRVQLVSKAIPMTVANEWMLWCTGWTNMGTGAITGGSNWSLDLGGATDFNNACEYRAEPTNWDGQEAFSATVNGSNSGATNKAFQLYVDGQLVGSAGPAPSSNLNHVAPSGYQGNATNISAASVLLWLDTSRYYNAKHRVALIVSGGTCSNCVNGTWTTMGTWEREVTFSNAATPVELTTNARDQKLLCPGAIPASCTIPVATLTGTIHYADQTTSVASLTCTSQNTSAVTVSGCTLTPVALGSAQIKAVDSATGLPRVSWAYVMAANTYPNVGIDATIQTGYVPGNSNFRRTGFFSGPMLADHQNSGFADAGYPGPQEAADMFAGGYNGAEVGLQSPPGLPGQSAPATETAYHNWAHPQTVYTCSTLGPLGAYFVGDNWVPSNGIYYGTRGNNLTFVTPSFQWLLGDWQSTCAHATRSNEMSDEITSVLTQGTQPCGASDTGCTIGSGDITQVACTAGTNCVASCTGAIGCKIDQDQFFIVTGSGTGLDYPLASVGNGPPVPVGVISNSGPGCLYNSLNACLTWPNPGVGTITYSATSNNCGAGGTSSCATLKIEPNIVNATFQGSAPYSPCNGVVGAAPCAEYTHSNAFITYYNQALAGNPKAVLTYAPSGQFSPNPLNEQRFCGGFTMTCDYYWSGTLGYLPTRSSIRSLNDFDSTNIDDINLMGPGYRNNFGLFGTKPTSVEISTGTTSNYAMTGYPKTITSCTGDQCLIPAHGLANVLNGFSRLYIINSTGANGLYMIRSTPDSSHIQLVNAVPGCHPCGSNTSQTLTFDDANTYTAAPGDTDITIGTGGCVSFGTNFKKERGHQFTASASPWSSFTWWYDVASSDVCADNWNFADFIWQVPNLTSTGGTAYIIPDAYMIRGRSWEGNGENGRYGPFAAINYGTVLGADGSREYLYATGLASGNPMSFDRTQKNPFGGQVDSDRRTFSNININFQAAGGHQVGVHPYYDIANSRIQWYSTALAQILQNRLAKYSMQPSLPSPDLGAWYEDAVRQDGSGNTGWFIQQFADEGSSLTVDLTPYKIPGQSIIKYVASLDSGIVVSTLASGTTTDTTNGTDGFFVAYIFEHAPSTVLSQPTLTVPLQSGATDVLFEWGYSPLTFQLTNIAPQVVRLTGGTGTLPIDSNIGTVYGRIRQVNGTTVLSTYPVQQF